MSEKTTSIKELFLEGFGLNPDEMILEKSYLVEEANIGIESIDRESNIVFSRIKYAVKKKEKKMYDIKFEDGRSLRVSEDHKFAILVNNNKEINWIEAKDIYENRKNFNYSFVGLEEPLNLLEIKEDGKDNPLDIEVEDTNCYFSNGVLSHNCMYGPDFRTASSGWAPKYYASWRARLTRTADIVDPDTKELTGIEMKVRNTKNKIGVPKREAILKLDFNSGINSDEEYLDYLVQLGIVQKHGAMYEVENDEWGMGRVRGIEAVKTFLKEHPDIYEDVKVQVNTLITGYTILDKNEDSEEESEKSEEEAWAEYEKESSEEN